MINFLIWFFALSGIAIWAFIIFVFINIVLEYWNSK